VPLAASIIHLICSRRRSSPRRYRTTTEPTARTRQVPMTTIPAAPVARARVPVEPPTTRPLTSRAPHELRTMATVPAR
jgi:hypothetical protein